MGGLRAVGLQPGACPRAEPGATPRGQTGGTWSAGIHGPETGEEGVDTRIKSAHDDFTLTDPPHRIVFCRGKNFSGSRLTPAILGLGRPGFGHMAPAADWAPSPPPALLARRRIPVRSVRCRGNAPRPGRGRVAPPRPSGVPGAKSRPGEGGPRWSAGGDGSSSRISSAS